MNRICTLCPLVLSVLGARSVLAQDTPDVPRPSAEPAPDRAPRDPIPIVDQEPPDPPSLRPPHRSAEITPASRAALRSQKTGPKVRTAKARTAATLGGTTGLLRIAAARGLDAGSLRLGFGVDFFRIESFFAPNDDHSRVGGTLSLAGAPTEFLEMWLNVRATSNRNERTRPTLIQSLGDLLLGIKGVYALDVFSFGADVQVRFLSGVADTSFDFGATELQLRALLSTNFQALIEELPLRAHLNAGFVFDNSEALVSDRTRLSNAERFALEVSEFHRVTAGLGLEAPVPYFTPYLEYRIEFPLDYFATPGVVLQAQTLTTAQTSGEPQTAVARPAFERVVPQVITPGVRFTAIPQLTLDLAVEIGITPDIGAGVLAVPDYNFVFLASYAFDPWNANPRTPAPPVSIPVLIPTPREPEVAQARVTGTVREERTNRTIGDAIVAFDRGPSVASTGDGRFVALPLEPGPVQVTVRRHGYHSRVVELELQAGQTADIEVVLSPSIFENPVAPLPPETSLVKIRGDRIILKSKVRFTAGRAELEADAIGALEQLADTLAQNQSLRKVRIEGHTDNVGTEQENMRLSQERAQAVLAYLVSRGVKPERLIAEGFGSSRPVAPNLTRRGRTQNRRVEFSIVEQP